MGSVAVDVEIGLVLYGIVGGTGDWDALGVEGDQQ